MVDVVLATEDCKFFFPSVRNGAGLPDSATAVYHLGLQWAKRLLLTGEIGSQSRFRSFSR